MLALIRTQRCSCCQRNRSAWEFTAGRRTCDGCRAARNKAPAPVADIEGARLQRDLTAALAAWRLPAGYLAPGMRRNLRCSL